MEQTNTDAESGSDVNAQSSSAGFTDSDMESAFSSNPALFSKGNSDNVESRSASVGATRNPDPVAKPVEADAQSAAKPEPDAQTNPGVSKQMKPAEKRIHKLSAQNKQLEERLTAQSFEMERMRRDLDLEREFRKTDRSRLEEFGGVDKRVSENDALREENRKITSEQELYRQYSHQLTQARAQAQTQAQSEVLLDEVDSVLEEMPLHPDPEISRTMFAKAWQRNPEASIRDLAKQLYEQTLSHYEPKYVEKFKGRTNPPAPVSPTGSRPMKTRYSDEDMIEEMNAALGKGWASSNG